ncbi:nitrate ABC transporter substrate-binding protein, partial [Burkholderia pseudomallei]
ALACRRAVVALYPTAARRLVRTRLAACAWLDDPAHRMQAARWLAQPVTIGVPVEEIAARLLGAYGAGPFAQPPAPFRF